MSTYYAYTGEQNAVYLEMLTYGYAAKIESQTTLSIVKWMVI